ncbi:MAG: hypothetical protein KAW16_07135 [candidate division Zixibacteria bacterium]|nr:hypothetical protein [candidate division Zixibacteria bacterium]
MKKEYNFSKGVRGKFYNRKGRLNLPIINTFTPEQHREALLRRRIKFVVEKGAMARLFPAGTHKALQNKLFQHIQPDAIAKHQTLGEYDSWLLGKVKLPCWNRYSRNGIKFDRWSYFGKLINIVVYEIVSNRELFLEKDWKRIKWFLHLPIDAKVIAELKKLDPNFPKIQILKGMTEDQYLNIQTAARSNAENLKKPSIWFEAAWSVG